MSNATRKKNHEMASHLKKLGIYHGKRMTSPTHNNYPSQDEVGSAAYRRKMK